MYSTRARSDQISSPSRRSADVTSSFRSCFTSSVPETSPTVLALRSILLNCNNPRRDSRLKNYLATSHDFTGWRVLPLLVAGHVSSSRVHVTPPSTSSSSRYWRELRLFFFFFSLLLRSSFQLSPPPFSRFRISNRFSQRSTSDWSNAWHGPSIHSRRMTTYTTLLFSLTFSLRFTLLSRADLRALYNSVSLVYHTSAQMIQFVAQFIFAIMSFHIGPESGCSYNNIRACRDGGASQCPSLVRDDTQQAVSKAKLFQLGTHIELRSFFLRNTWLRWACIYIRYASCIWVFVCVSVGSFFVESWPWHERD